ncbi:hypothetical protein MOPEL_029_00850 [Mobilicoccus pelagius NBRC 104925]|uniref:ARB-07466-like C-terminal domain-containing protein n=1 Tax=Mobilicoccus pelagius NBRC 104925 TaxID=1089455 RepID=H5UPZ9_9MICO|nr:hypothetical protein MOPEL_029_00850 [Mobilicoccus pelagius NBRC 104925]
MTTAGLTAPPASARSSWVPPSVRLAETVANHPQSAFECRLIDTPGSRGLRNWPSAVRSRIAAQFGLTDIGGYRPGEGRSDHHSGRALDIMVRGDAGTEVAEWVRAHAGELNVKYVIWQQGYWQPGMNGYRPMKDRGSETANHWDHVHVSFYRGSGTCPFR